MRTYYRSKCIARRMQGGGMYKYVIWVGEICECISEIHTYIQTIQQQTIQCAYIHTILCI